MKVFGVLVILSLVVYTRGNSEVTESISPYDCCLNTTLQIDPTCTTLWTVNGTPFARTHRHHLDCISPCKEIGASWITLDACINVNLKKVCRMAGEAVETRISYLGRICPSMIEMAHGSQGSLSSPLLPVICGLLLVQRIY